MKRMLTLAIALALLLTSAAGALAAELPDCFVPTSMMMGFNTRLPNVFKAIGDANPAGTMAQYMLKNPELLSDGMRFSNDAGSVTLEARGNDDPSGPAGTMALTIGGAVNAIHATALQTAFLGVVSDSDPSVTSAALTDWLGKASKEGDLALNGYTLSLRREGLAEVLTLTSDEAAAPAQVEPEPAPAQAAELPDFFVPQTAAIWFNSLLSQALEMLGAPNPESMAKDYKLTKADIVGSALFLSSADGRVEISASFEDGQPTVDKQATTLGLAMAKDVSRSELLSLGATFFLALAQTDDSVTDLEALLNWMTDSVDGGDGAVYPMNGYNLVYARGENGYMFTLVPVGAATAPAATPEPAATEQPTPEATAEPTPEPTAEPTPAPEALEGAVLEWNGVYLKPTEYSIRAYSDDHITMKLYFRILNTTDTFYWVDVGDISIDGNRDVNSTGIGKAKPYYDSGEDTPDYALVSVDYDEGVSGMRAIADARRVTLSIVLKDEKFKQVYTQDLTLDLNAMEGTRDVPDDFRPAPVPTREPVRTAADFNTLKQGSKGQAVRELQQRLIDLGYLNGKADGAYGKKTVAAVRTFCEQNGLGTDGGNASPEMQAKLFSSSAKAYSEAYIPLVIGAKSQYDPVRKVNTFFFKTQVMNTSKTRTIRGFELKCYTTNVWGDRLDNGVVYSMTNTIRVKPGETVWSNSFNLGNWYSVDTVWIGISKIVFDDGEIRDVSNVEYYSSVMPSKK